MLNKKGFSLIEILVSISVALVIMASVFSFIIQNINLKRNIQNDFMLNEIAKEGIEVISFMRDKNYSDGRSYSYNIDSVSARKTILILNKTNNTWSINDISSASTIDTCSLDNTCSVYTNNSVYVQDVTGSGLTRTNFSRLITITRNDANHFTVVSEASYKENNIVKKKVKLVKEIWDIQ